MFTTQNSLWDYLDRYGGHGAQQYQSREFREKLAGVDPLAWEGKMDPYYAATLPEDYFPGHPAPYQSDIGIKSAKLWNEWKALYWQAKGRQTAPGIGISRKDGPRTSDAPLDPYGNDDMKESLKRFEADLEGKGAVYGFKMPPSFMEELDRRISQGSFGVAQEMMNRMGTLLTGVDPNTGRMILYADETPWGAYLDEHWQHYM